MNLLTFSLGLLSGILFDRLFPLPFLFWYCLLGGSGFFAIAASREARKYRLDHPSKTLAVSLLTIAVFATGGLRSAIVREASVAADPFETVPIESPVCFEGVVSDLPVKAISRRTIAARMLARCGRTESEEIRNLNVLLTLPITGAAPEYGARIRVEGKRTIIPAESRSSYYRYLRRNGILFLFYRPELTVLPGFSGNPLLSAIYRVRSSFVDRIFRLFPSPEAPLIAGILVGDEAKIPSEVDDAFRRTGTAHIIAISGMNFTVLIWILAAIVRRVSTRWWISLTLLPFILLYTLLTGASAPIVRAAILSALTLIADTFGERKNGESALAFSAALMSFVRPMILFDVGFQLSVMATLGILFFNQPLANLVRKGLSRSGLSDAKALGTVVDLLNDLILTSLSAQVFTTFIGAAAFSQFSRVSLAANAAIALFQSPIMIGGFVALLVSYLWTPIGMGIAWLITPAASLTIRVVELFAAVPGASSYFRVSSTQAWLSCAAIALIWKLRGRIAALPKREIPFALGTSAALIFALACWRVGLGRLRLFPDRYEIRYEALRSAMTLTIRTPGMNEFILGENLNGYEAEEKLFRPGPARFRRVFARVTTAEPWIGKRIAEAYEGDPDVLILNGARIPSPTAELDMLLRLTEAADDDTGSIQLGAVNVAFPVRFLRREAWVVTIGRFRLLIPNGIAPERLVHENPLDESQARSEIFSATMILLQRDDRRADWEAWLAEAVSAEPFLVPPILIHAKTNPQFVLRTNGEQVFYKPVE